MDTDKGNCCMVGAKTKSIEKSVRLDGTDIEVWVRLEDTTMTIDVKKSNVCVHTVIIDQASDPIENSWLADLFAREDRVELRDLAKEVDDYVLGSNTNQG